MHAFKNTPITYLRIYKSTANISTHLQILLSHIHRFANTPLIYEQIYKYTLTYTCIYKYTPNIYTNSKIHPSYMRQHLQIESSHVHPLTNEFLRYGPNDKCMIHLIKHLQIHYQRMHS